MDEPKRPPVREAVALEYGAGLKAPKVVAAGKGYVAEKIIDTARKHAIPVQEDPALAHALNLLKIGDEIPPELYQVVAQILIFVGDLDKHAAPPAPYVPPGD